MCQRTLERLWQWTATDSVMRQRFQRLTVSRYCTLLYYLVANAGLDVFKSIHFACRGAAGHKCERCWVYTTDVGDCEVAWLCTACCMLRFGLAEHLGVKLVAASIKRLFTGTSIAMHALCWCCPGNGRSALSVRWRQLDSCPSPSWFHLYFLEVPSPLETSAVCYWAFPLAPNTVFKYFRCDNMSRTNTYYSCSMQRIMIAEVIVMLQHVAITDIWNLKQRSSGLMSAELQRRETFICEAW